MFIVIGPNPGPWHDCPICLRHYESLIAGVYLRQPRCWIDRRVAAIESGLGDMPEALLAKVYAGLVARGTLLGTMGGPHDQVELYYHTANMRRPQATAGGTE